MNIGIKAVLYKLRFFFIPYLILIAACLIIKLTYSREEIYFAVNARNWTWADTIAPYITDIGEGLTTVILAAIIALFNYRKAFILIGSWVVTSLVAQVLKFTFAAPRPKLYFHDQLAKIHFVAGTNQLSLHSFPSGHTVTAFASAIVITYLCRNKFWGLPLLFLAMLVGYSRMYLSQHFFEDVTAGSVIGVVVTMIWLWWTENREFLKSPIWNRGLFKQSTKLTGSVNIIYSLEKDINTISMIQSASNSNSIKNGFEIENGLLFGTKEWFDAIEKGNVAKHYVIGTISDVYMAGHNDYPQFDIENERGRTTWARIGRDSAYKKGSKVELIYVEQKYKGRKDTSEVIIEIKIYD